MAGVDRLCPNVRKRVAVQFFRVVFKENLVIGLRFASNFAYVAFALNRIALIGTSGGHGKLVEKVSKASVRKYLAITCLISLGLSVVKSFKYRVNYEHEERNYPFSIEAHLWVTTTLFQNVFFVVNTISDLLNYFVFLFLHLAIDVYMLVRLRATLNEKLARFGANSAATNNQQAAAARKQQEILEAKSNATRMVVINSTLNILFKLPLTLMPTINLVTAYIYIHRKRTGASVEDINRFTSNMFRTGCMYLITDVSDWLLTILVSVQFFIYVRFDKKMRLATRRYFNLESN